MKLSRLITLLAVLAAVTLSQGAALADYSFELLVPETELESEIGVIAAFDNVMHNTGSSDDVYTVTMVKNSPEDWVATMCSGTTCFPPFITEIEVELAAGEEKDLIIDITPQSPGVGSVSITIVSQNDGSINVVTVFTVNTPGMGGPNFEFAAEDHGAISAIGNLQAFHATLTNNSGASDTYTIALTKNMDASWVGTICEGETCYPPFITEINVTLADGEQTNIDIDITAQSIGEGTIVVDVVSGNNPDMTDSLNFTAITPGLDVLLVAGDNGGGFDAWYRTSLEAIGNTVGTWDRQEMGQLEVFEIAEFETVVWETGNINGGLDINDFSALAYFINHGGDLFLSGQNLAYSYCDPTSPFFSSSSVGWFQNILHTDYDFADESAMAAFGAEGDIVTGDLAFMLSGGDGAGNNTSLDALTTYGDGIGSMYYDSGNLAVTRGLYGDGKTFFCGFGFEGIDSAENRNALMSQVMAWFNDELTPAGDMVAPLLASKPYASPNPFNPQTSIMFEVGGTKNVNADVVVFNLKGQAVRNIFQGSVSPGPQNLVWDGRNNDGRNLATGVYFARVRLNEEAETVKMTLVK